MNKFYQLISLFRLLNVLLVILAQYIIAKAMQYHPFHIPYFSAALLVVFSTFLILLAGYLQNNLLDYSLDLLEKKRKNDWIEQYPNVLKIGSWSLYFLGIATSILVSFSIQKISIAFLTILAVLLLNSYNFYLKKTPLIGNLAISFLCVLSIILIYLCFPINQDKISFNNPILFLIFFFTLYREIVKNLEDQTADQHYGYNTLPIVLGPKLTSHWLLMANGLFTIYLMYLNFFWQIVMSIILFQTASLYAIYTQKFSLASSILKTLFALGVLFLAFQL